MSGTLRLLVPLVLLGGAPGSSGAVIVSSSSSSYQTSCNGLLCPAGSNCMAYSGNIHGKKTSDKRCTNYEGKIIRQETVTIENGEMCIKNATMVNGILEAERTCRKLRKKEEDMNNAEDLPLVIRDQDSLEDAIQNQERFTEWWNEKLDKNADEKMEALERQQEEKELLEDTQRDLYERLADARDEAMDRQADALQEKLERQVEMREALLDFKQEAKIAKMERNKEIMEKKAELYEKIMEREEEVRQEQLNRALEAIQRAADARKYR